MSDERPIEHTTDRFIGRTISALDASCCNDLVFTFEDGGRVALHIEVRDGLPDIASCTTCV